MWWWWLGAWCVGVLILLWSLWPLWSKSVMATTVNVSFRPLKEFLTSDLYLSLATEAPEERVFVKTDVLHTGPMWWRGVWHEPKLDRPVVLSGQSDHALTPSIVAQYPAVKHWFAINNQSMDSRVTTLPLGLTNNTDESPYHRVFGHQDELRRVQHMRKASPAQNLVYLNFSLATHPSRAEVWQWFCGESWVTVGKSEATMDGRAAYLQALRQHDFCLCPRGNGLDTHRLWEALYLETIPVVEYDPAYEAFRDLPIYFIMDWQREVTPDQLRSVKAAFASRCWNRDKLYWPYWRETIRWYPRLAERVSFVAGQGSWVLIHLGPPLPAYARDCVKQIRRVDPDQTVIIVCEHDPGYGVGTVWVPLSEVPVSSWRQQFMETTKLNPLVREGFWKWACLRLLVLHDLMEYARLRHVMHIEYDNLVYFSLAWFLQCLPETVSWACPRLGARRLLANIFFVRQPEPLRALMEFILSHTYDNEMRYLHEFQKTATPEYRGYELPTTTDHVNFGAFGSIFDAAALGQCVGGVDPRNKPGNTMGFVNEDSPWSDLKPSWVSWKAAQSPVFRETTVIRNLHVHCKNLAQFL